jgi:hypothetical protein
MSIPLKREVLLDVIQRCAWLIVYYERIGVAPESVQTFQAKMAKAINDLEALAPSVSHAVSEESTNFPLECPMSPT